MYAVGSYICFLFIVNEILFFLLLTTLVFPEFFFGQDVGIWRAGSAYKLENSVYTLSCFISDTAGDWTYEEKLNVLRKLDSSTNWISRQAANYNIAIEFKNGNCGLMNDIKLPEIERGTASGNERVDLVSTILAKTGYKTPAEFYHTATKSSRCKNVQVIFFAKGKGNGYAMQFGSSMDKDLYFVEGAILYEKYWNGYGLTPSSIAHEILHLYGLGICIKHFSNHRKMQIGLRHSSLTQSCCGVHLTWKN